MTVLTPPSDTVEPLSYSIPAAAEVISKPPVSRATMYRLIKNGELDVVKIGKRSLVTAASIRRLIGEAA